MSHIARALKSVFSSAEERPDQVSGSVVPKQVPAFLQQRLSPDLIDNASEIYSKASLHLSNLTDKSQGELFFIASILAAVILFVIILPAYEAFFLNRTTQSKAATVMKSVPSPSSSTTDSLQTIEESEDEDLTMPIEKDEIIELSEQGSLQDMQVALFQQGSVEHMQDILNKSVDVVEQACDPPSDQPLHFVNRAESQVYDADETEEIVDADEKEGAVDADAREAVANADGEHSDSTPVTAVEGFETPTSSHPISPNYAKPDLIRDYVSVPDVALQKRSSFGKLGKRLTSTRLGFGRKDSSDASVSSIRSLRKLSIRGLGKKKGLGVK